MFMLIVTTIALDQLSHLIKDKTVTLDNSNLIFGRSYDGVAKYLEEITGTGGYVLGIRGKINNNSAALLSKLDKGLSVNKLLIEANVDDNDVIAFDVSRLEEAVDILSYGLPLETLYEHLDNSIIEVNKGQKTKGVQVICVPSLNVGSDIKVTSLNSKLSIDAESITVVNLKGKSDI